MKSWEACFSLDATMVNKFQHKEDQKRTYGGNGPHIIVMQELQRQSQWLFRARHWDKQLGLIIGLIFRRKRQWGGRDGLSFVPTRTSHSFALDVRQHWSLFLLTTSLHLHPPVSRYLASNILSRKKPINFLTLQHFHVFYQGVSGSVCHACNDTLAVTEWHGD